MKAHKNSFGSDLIIGILSFLMISLSFFTYSEYKENKKNSDAFEVEKRIIDNQFTEILNSLDNVRSENELINKELLIAKNRIGGLRDSLRMAAIDLSSIFKFREQLNHVTNDKQRLLNLIDSLDVKNKELIAELGDREQELYLQRKYANQLNKEKSRLEGDIKKASHVSATSFKADGIRVKSNGKLIVEDRSRRTEKIRVCFTMSENLFAKTGKKSIYVQILDPNNNIVGEKLKADLQSDSELIFSTKTVINYENEALDLCVFVDAEKKKLAKGTYFINVFEGERKIGNTYLNLK
ncbi:MAG: hypothetical protein HRT68_06385 [Flavobacteriaceae bacterium]|nr:hypothetical protein [Flavobacteriaceae bacterium]